MLRHLHLYASVNLIVFILFDQIHRVMVICVPNNSVPSTSVHGNAGC